MEKSKDILIKEYNSYSLLTSCLYIDKYDLMACGDNLGRLLIFDHRVPKPFVQLIKMKYQIFNIRTKMMNYFFLVMIQYIHVITSQIHT